MFERFKKDRKLGVAEGRRKYDIPLNKDGGTDFLIVLVALMTFLTVMALSSAFALNDLTDRWSSGLENKLTVEIPAQGKDGKLLDSETIAARTKSAQDALEKHKAVKSVSVLGDSDIQDLLSPWLGDDMEFSDMPLPGLISVDLHITTPEILSDIREALRGTVPSAEIDAHESWLNDILRLTGSLQFAAAFITLVIIGTTIIAVMGAIRSRMAIHKSDIELLHLMGASDPYISKQFQRHAFTLGLQGSAFGVLASAVILFTIYMLSGTGENSVLPKIQMQWAHMFIIFCIPAVACAISAATARLTVLRDLRKMP